MGGPQYVMLWREEVWTSCVYSSRKAWTQRHRTITGKTLLHRAVQNGTVDLAHFLVECGTDTTVKDKDGLTPLHLAMLNSRRRVLLARLLVEHGADATTQDNRRCTPLHLAMQQGSVDLARFFMEHGTMLSSGQAG